MGKYMILAATSTSKSGGGSYLFLVAIVVLFGLLYFVTIRPQRNRQRAAMQTQREVVPGTRVRTTAGMYGTVMSVEDADVILEVAPGVEVRFLRRAIMDVVPEAGENMMPGTGQMDVGESSPEDSENFGAEDDAATGG
jgi:preprotein translocase subunit YajC